MSYQAESSLVMYDGQIISATRGSPAAVEFDFEAVWEFRKKIGKDHFNPKLLTWLHVHPPGFGVQASSQDRKCIQALRAGLGPEIGEFGIFSFDDDSLNNIEGFVAWYVYHNGDLHPMEHGGHVASLYDREAHILKALSYVPARGHPKSYLDLLRRVRDAMSFDQWPEPEQLRDMIGIIKEIDETLGDRSEYFKGWDRMLQAMKELPGRLK